MLIKPSYFRNFIFVSIVLILQSCGGFKYTSLYEGFAAEGTHSRGIQLLEDKVVVTGAAGVISIHSFDGKLIERDTILGVDDFRDVFVISDSLMLLMNSSDNARIIYRAKGERDKKVYNRSGAFLDGFDFWDKENGMCYGDPVRNRFFLLKTTNGGKSWSRLSPSDLPTPKGKEAGFAASGTGIDCVGDSTVYFGTGMTKQPHLFVSHNRGRTWDTKECPIKGGDANGIYSLYFWNEKEGVVIGGSYLNPEANDSICFYTPDGGDTWIDRSGGLGGYCSSIQGTKNGKLLIATGRTATYWSKNKGQTWNKLFDRKYYSIAISETHIAFCGKNGVLEILEY